MRIIQNRYTFLGVGLLTGGALFALLSGLIIEYMPLTALGMSGVLLGAVSLSLSRTLPRVSMETAQLLLEAGLDNIAALIEELGLRSQAIYLPTSVTNGVGRALIAVEVFPSGTTLQGRLELRLLVRLGREPEDFGILVATPGSGVLTMEEIPRTSSVMELGEKLTSIVVGRLDLAKGVRIPADGESVQVEFSGAALASHSHPVDAILGTPLASIAAAVVAEGLERPVSISSETLNGTRRVVELRLHDPMEP